MTRNWFCCTLYCTIIITPCSSYSCSKPCRLAKYCRTGGHPPMSPLGYATANSFFPDTIFSENDIFNDVTITSSLRSVVQALIGHFTIFQSHGLSGWFVPMKSCLNLSKLRPKYCRYLFTDTVTVYKLFLPRDAMHKRGYCCHAVSVCLSVTFVSCAKINTDILEFFFTLG